MSFNSIEYFLFFPIVLLLYYALPVRWQNRMLLVASYFFYGCWDWRFLSLILISTITDYFCGIKIYNNTSKKAKLNYLCLSIIINLTILGFFKYWNFFSETLMVLLNQFGLQHSAPTLNIILPVGISFYTFKIMTYSIDIYRGEMKPTYNFIDLALFVSFFPQLVSGPIDRAKTMLPQIQNKRHFGKDQLYKGLSLIFWGLFKKVFVADNLGIIVDQVYNNPAATGLEYIIATWAFAFQIYGDFSGYSDIAQGSAKCLGIEIMSNFRQPYFAINPSDFWRRWHISLSFWFRDYLYISLGGNRKGVWKTHRNLIITMLLCGLWHGAAWNYIIWGAYHGLLLSGHRIFKSLRHNGSPSNKSLTIYMVKAFIMFQLTSFGWIFFRAESLSHIKSILHSILSLQLSTPFGGEVLGKVIFFSALPIIVMALKTLREIKTLYFKDNSLLNNISSFSRQPIFVKSFFYGVMTYLLCFYGAKADSFIYLQF